MSKKIVVLGAGYAGVLIAKKLEKQIKKQNIDADVTIIDKNPFHTMLTELHEVAAGRVDESSIRIELKKIFANRNVNVVMDTIVDADYGGNVLKGEKASYNYDYLVMASGCKSTYFGVKGAAENAFPLWSYQDAVDLRDHISAMFRGAAVESDPEKRKAMLTFYIIGAGFTGVEMAGELAEYAPILCEKFKLNKEEVRIFNVDVMDKIMPILPDKSRERVMKRFEKTGVEVLLKTNVTGISADGIEFTRGDQPQKDASKTIIWAAGTEGSDIAQKSEALGLAPRSRGRIQTDKYLRSLEHPNVYVAGDNIFYIPEGETAPIPQMVENAEHCAPLIAGNILEEVKGAKPSREYKPQFHGVMVCVGGKYGTAYGGLPGKFFVQPSFFAMLAKHFINVVYFFQILGFNKVISYLTAEFFTIRNGRSFLGGHFSNRSPSFFSFPLRIYMGVHFAFSVYYRIEFRSFLEAPLLRDIFYRVANTPRPMPFDFAQLNILDMVHFQAYHIAQWHLILMSTPVSWFVTNFVIASPGQEMFWQWMIIIFEVLLAGAFFAGLFTTLASVGALFGALWIMMTVGLPMTLWWVIFASFALMFTGSRTLSLDYWVMPRLKARWKNSAFAKKWYLYID
ncbi:MAG: NAD(P)/FAD-dependent oxidoreductase [Spirochaetes bacterium]|nr:NAD(P)/FAD-dependent oxidoreductase [Spirochaetota bacterium]